MPPQAGSSSAASAATTATTSTEIITTQTTTSTSTNNFLVLCTVDGSIFVLDAVTGSLQSGFSSGVPLVGASAALDANGRRIVPGLDGQLYLSTTSSDESSESSGSLLQPLSLSILDVLQNPVKTCSSSSSSSTASSGGASSQPQTDDCGIVTATKNATLFALEATTGELVWYQSPNGKTTRTTTTTSPFRSSTVLLQREDVMVRQVSTDTGSHVWNITLGTFQALEFGDHEQESSQDDESSLLKDSSDGGTSPLVAVQDNSNQDAHDGRGHDDSSSSSSSRKMDSSATVPLPSLMFGADGTSLKAVDATTTVDSTQPTVLWTIQLDHVVASVFGLSDKTWKPLVVLDNDDEDEDDIHNNHHDQDDGAVVDPTRLLLPHKSSVRDTIIEHQAHGLFVYQPPLLDTALVLSRGGGSSNKQHHNMDYHDNYLLQDDHARLTRQFLEAQDYDRLQQAARLLELPASAALEQQQGGQQRLQSYNTSEGLFLTWPLLTAIVTGIALVGGLVVRFAYVQKKQKWLGLIARATSSVGTTPHVDHRHSSLSASPNRKNVSFDHRNVHSTGGFISNRKLMKRSQSMPEVVHHKGQKEPDVTTTTTGDGSWDNMLAKAMIRIRDEEQRKKAITGDLPTEDKEGNNDTTKPTVAGSSLASSSTLLEPAGLVDGIPLVRYSRYSSEFEEVCALGKGGFGTVFRCKNALDGREYAIKKVRIDERQPTEFSQRLKRVLREVKILAVLDHANIVRYYTAWLELERISVGEQGAHGHSKGKGGDHSAIMPSTGASDYYLLSTRNDTARRFSSDLLASPSSPHYLQGRRPSLEHLNLTDKNNPLGWDNFLENEDDDSLIQQLANATPMALDDYGFTFDRSEQSTSRNTDGHSSSAQLNTATMGQSGLRGSFSKQALTTKKSTDNKQEEDSKDSSTSWAGSESESSNESSSSKRAGEESTEEVTTGIPVQADETHVVPKENVRHTLYIQMQLCSQKTLADFLSDKEARRGPSLSDRLDIPYALSLFLQIAQGVKYVHEQGLIHRDLKPNNCFMDEESGAVKVGDFGLSRESGLKDTAEVFSSAQLDAADGTDNTAGVGTRSYASPEQMNGSDYDSSTDIYSLGIILFELCFPMYTGMERHIVFSKLRNHTFPDEWHEDVASAFPTLHALLCSMISNRPSERPTAEAVAREVQSILEEFTITSLDKDHYECGAILLRVEAKPREDVLRHTIELVKEASQPDNIEIAQYGLRGGTNKTIMEFAIRPVLDGTEDEEEGEGSSASSPSALGSRLVANLSESNDLLLIRQVSGTKYI